MEETQSILDEMKQAQALKFEEKMAMITLIGNLTSQRDNFKNNSNKSKVLVGRNKMLALINRFKV